MNTPELETTLDRVLGLPIGPERRALHEPIIDFITQELRTKSGVDLNFICTHNSRRSQLAQVWASYAAQLFELPIRAHSAGVEVTACDARTVAALRRAGFRIAEEPGVAQPTNPRYTVRWSAGLGAERKPAALELFSKHVDGPHGPGAPFVALMTCSDADQNCPFLPGAAARFTFSFEDPKHFDGTPSEERAYDERSDQIASELFYLCAQVKDRITN